jgi:hypothetical protein
VDAAFCPTEATVESGRIPFPPATKLGAIVTAEQNDRVVAEPVLLKGFHETPDPVVHAFDHRVDMAHPMVLASVFQEGLQVLGTRLQRPMRRIVGEVKEKWGGGHGGTRCVPPDKPDGFVGEKIGQIRAVALGNSAISIQPIIEVMRPACPEPGELIKAPCVRMVPGLHTPAVPLADAAGMIALAAEHVGKGDFPGGQTIFASKANGVDDSGAEWIATGQQSRPRGRTER